MFVSRVVVFALFWLGVWSVLVWFECCCSEVSVLSSWLGLCVWFVLLVVFWGCVVVWVCVDLADLDVLLCLLLWVGG